MIMLHVEGKSLELARDFATCRACLANIARTPAARFTVAWPMEDDLDLAYRMRAEDIGPAPEEDVVVSNHQERRCSKCPETLTRNFRLPKTKPQLVFAKQAREAGLTLEELRQFRYQGLPENLRWWSALF